MTLVDEDRRRRILTDLETTLLVEAAAGTGKTSLMAGRVAMLASEAPPFGKGMRIGVGNRHPGEVGGVLVLEIVAARDARPLRRR